MPAKVNRPTHVREWDPRELRKLPPAERDEILRLAAERAEADYRNDPELTAFEAFGAEDLHGDSADAQEG